MMKPEYYSYQCLCCNKTFVIVRVEKAYKALLTCPHCRGVNLKRVGAYDDMRRCMEERPKNI